MYPVLGDKTRAAVQRLFVKAQERRMAWAFGPRIHPTTHQPQWHNGCDFGAAVGTPLYAVYDGVVAAVWNDVKYYGGNSVTIRHAVPGVSIVRTGYAHMSAFSVQPGDKVKAGDVIGKSGETGRCDGAHLHFTCRTKKNSVETAVNPLPYVIESVGLVPPTTLVSALLPGISFEGVAFAGMFTNDSTELGRVGTIPTLREDSAIGQTLSMLNASMPAAVSRAVSFSLLTREALDIMSSVQTAGSRDQVAMIMATRNNLMAAAELPPAQENSDAVLFNPVTGLYGDGTSS
jgi:hypothetical protein